MAWTYVPATDVAGEYWIDDSNPAYPLFSRTNPDAPFANQTAALESLYMPYVGGNQAQIESIIAAAPERYSQFGITPQNAGSLVDSTFYDRVHNIYKNDFIDVIGQGALGALYGAALGDFTGLLNVDKTMGNLFGSPSGVVAEGAMPTQVGGWSSEMPNWYETDWGSEGLVDLGSSGYNAVNANDPIGALIQNLESGMTPSQAVSAVEASLPGTTRSAIEQALYSLGSNANSLGGKLLSSLFGGSTTGGLSSLFGNGLFGNGLGGLFDKAAATAPVLAAINYARNQDPFDTSRLTSLYDQYDPSKLAYEYDLNTGRGREQLTSGLQNRGVMGSSFGNMDITNFNTTRELGRQSLINQGIGQRGQIASNILDAEVKGRQLKNQLYGSSLLALGNVFGGRSSPTINWGNP